MLKNIIIIFICNFIVIIAYVLIKHNNNLENIKKNKLNDNIINKSTNILQIVHSNNTYFPILDVFNILEKNLSNSEINLHADLRGYLDNEQSDFKTL